MPTSNQAIGLFDSGIGGLTVFKSLSEAFPDESFIYLGDTARLPYGSKSPETIERYVKQNIEFLVQHKVKAVVVACNTASTILVGRNLKFPVPVYNVIEPGAKKALSVTRDKRIGVLGTRATVAAGSYVKAIQALDQKAQVWQQACPLLVPLVEEGWEEDPITNLVVFRYLGPMVQQIKIDTLILGCTHYPVLRNSIQKVTGHAVELVDSAEAIAHQFRQDFDNGVLKRSSGKKHENKIMVTDDSLVFKEVAGRLMHPAHIANITCVDL